jgi:TDG/mug DNA glycosylase family protein
MAIFSRRNMPTHRVTELWMRKEIETLEDLLRPGLKAVCVGINPAPDSVKAGHYYQGKLGRAFFSRLIGAGVVPSNQDDFMDDVSFASGVGFTDIIKRPTRSARELAADEYEFGRDLLIKKLQVNKPSLVIFTFKKTAEIIFGKFAGNGFVNEMLGGSDVFVMPGPYESAVSARDTMNELASHFSK